jgi:dolichol-phosphate mannosyltransferase
MGGTYHILEPRCRPRLLSLVMPLYDEQDVLPWTRQAVSAFLDTLDCDAEVILVNDGSRDRTIELLADWARADRRVKVISLARNFGHQIAVTAGLDAARGDAVVVIDADLQDPLEVVPRMIDRYCEGYDVVYGRRIARQGETLFKRFSAWLFYRLMRTLIHGDLPADAGDFRLISRPCLDALRQMRETHRFLRGMVAWVGFAQTDVPFERRRRAAGETKYSLAKMLRFAWTAAVSFSPFPLRLSLGIGVLLSLGGFAYGVYAVIRVAMGLYVVPGWTSTMVALCLVGGGILIGIGILGEYVARIFEACKGRPLYVVSRRLNIAESAGDAEASRPAPAAPVIAVYRELPAQPRPSSDQAAPPFSRLESARSTPAPPLPPVPSRS